MLIGVNLPNYSRLGNRDSIVAIAEAAEALGYASLWTNDHVLLPTSRPEPFGNVLESLTTLSYLAAALFLLACHAYGRNRPSAFVG